MAEPGSETDWETASEEHAIGHGSEVDGGHPGGSGASAANWSAADVAKGVNQHGCEHYRRRCKLVAPCCGDVVWCRHCHNALRSDNEQDPKKRHILDRKAVTEVVCALCDTRQPAATQCMHCGAGFGLFSCLKCKFYDDDVSKEQFHCGKCGICRVGGRANYFHCDRCNCCYALALQDTHTCIENSMHHNCPVCFEYLFDSVKPIQVLPCGHTIHQDCLKSMAEHHSFTCPECNKSFLNAAQMAGVWARMDAAVAATAMPDEYKNMKVHILCNDCNKRCSVNFHVVGHKCSSCGSYNTARV